MKALLLAAGLGTRLKPITDTIPKCLVPINGRPLLAYWLDMLDCAGIDEFFINVHYHAKAVREFVEQSRHESAITIIEEENLPGTGGTLKKNADIFSDAPFFLAHADNICLTDFKGFIEAHDNRPEGVDITMMTFDPPDPRSCGVVTLDKRGVVTAFYEKHENPPARIANGAVFVMEPQVARFAAQVDQDEFEISLDILPHYISRMLAWHNGDYHLDIGTPETYKQAQEDGELIDSLFARFTRKQGGD